MKPSKYNCFTPGLCAITGEIRTRSYLIDELSPKTYGRAGRNGTAAERTEKTLAYAQGSHLRIGQPADSGKRRRMSKAAI